MQRSILFYNPQTTAHIPDQTVNDLSLPTVLSLVHRDQEATRLVLDILSHPCRHPHIIAKRQAVLQDWIANQGAAQHVIDLCDDILEQISEHKKVSRRFHTDPHQTDRSGWLLSVQNAAEILLRVLEYYTKFSNHLSSLQLSSAVLISLRNDMTALVESDDFDRLCDMLLPLTNIRSKDTSYICSATLSQDLYRIRYQLIRVVPQMHIQKDVPITADVCRLNASEKLLAERIALSTLKGLYDYLWQTAQLLSSYFQDLREELLFYDFGERYARLLADKQIPFSWPTISSESATSFHALHDIYLSLSNPKPPIPNQYQERDLCVITGENNSGKTVFMRSVATAQLFAQAGLPIPAKKAIVKVKKNIYTVYAADEKDLGRFEEECCILAKIIQTIDDCDILLMNEPFQSTDYSQASEILFDVLSAFREARIPVMIVTHLTELHDQLRKEHANNSAFYKAASAYCFAEEQP